MTLRHEGMVGDGGKRSLHRQWNVRYWFRSSDALGAAKVALVQWAAFKPRQLAADDSRCPSFRLAAVQGTQNSSINQPMGLTRGTRLPLGPGIMTITDRVSWGPMLTCKGRSEP